MKFKKPKLHIQIFIGLALGAIFGGIFHVDSHKLLLLTSQRGESKQFEIHDWKKITIESTEGINSFEADDQLLILKSFRSLTPEQRSSAKIIAFFERDSIAYENVQTLAKEKTVATEIKPLGDIFIRLLMMIAVPLVLASLLVGAASLHDIRRMARIGGKTITYFLSTTALAIAVGLVIGNIIQPGHRMDTGTRDRLLSVYAEDASAKLKQDVSINVIDQIIRMVPKNPFAAMAEGDMLAVIFFAVLLGLVSTQIPKEKSERLIGFFDALSEAMIKLVDLVMLIAPFAVFALISATIGEFGFGIIQTLFWYMATVLLGLIIQTFFVYPVFLKLFSPMSMLTFFKTMRPAQLVAFTTSSSAATLPVNFECCEKMGVPKSVTSFVLPLGATINMDGTAIYQGVATLFIAQVYGMELSLAQQITIVLMATLASIGTAPVPGVGIVMLLIVLRSVGVPEEGIALILGVDRILDMCRTVPNITGDATGSVIVASTEKVLGTVKNEG